MEKESTIIVSRAQPCGECGTQLLVGSMGYIILRPYDHQVLCKSCWQVTIAATLTEATTNR